MALKSRLESANDSTTDFPLENLPFGVFAPNNIGIAIGDEVLDLGIPGPLNNIAGQHRELRARAHAQLAYGSAEPRPALIPIRDCEMLLPFAVGDYTDFYASLHHATNIGKLFRPDNPLLPNYKYIPIGYHGRASSIVVSGTPIRRPEGQTKGPSDPAPHFGPTRRLDYELELGVFMARGNPLGSPIPIAEAPGHIFGYCLVNDWSARDIQAWEYQPLGPFLAKSFATSISPWVITAEALEPFHLPPPGNAPLDYLKAPNDFALDITLEVWLGSHRLSRGNFRDMYWTVSQLIAHHASNGCNLRPGDLLASGTVSGESPEARGCLLELTRGGAEPIRLPNGEPRTFLEDGDEIILRGRCEREGATPIGFGECRGRIQAAHPDSR